MIAENSHWLALAQLSDHELETGPYGDREIAGVKIYTVKIYKRRMQETPTPAKPSVAAIDLDEILTDLLEIAGFIMGNILFLTALSFLKIT